MNCKSCNWWKFIGATTTLGQELGECRRNAPVLGLSDLRANDEGKWPLTVATDYCGEFERWSDYVHDDESLAAIDRAES